MTDADHIRDEELELFALGGLPDEQAATLKAHVASCGECAMKLAQSRGNAALLAFSAKPERPAGTIKAELMARIRANHEREEQDAWALPRSEPPSVQPGAVPERPGSWRNWVFVPAAVALAIVSLALSWQNRKVSQALEKQRQNTQILLHEREETERLIGVLAAADTFTVKMAPAADTMGNGIVKYNARMGMLAYSAELPPPSAGKSYQMWLVPVNGSPINAGLMGKGTHPLGRVWVAEVPPNTEAKAFAITLEPAGGMPQPTGPKVLVGAR